MKDILIIVSTYNRLDLTGITLDSLRRCKSAASDVLILDDHSDIYSACWLREWGWPVEQRKETVGVGPAALLRYLRFMDSGYRYLCAVYNDVIFGAQFDYRLRQLWEIAKDPNQLTILTGYHSVTQTTLEDHDDYITVDGVGGASHFLDWETAQALIALMPKDWWVHNWDHRISKVYQRKLAPKRSLLQHLGIYGSGVNGPSLDVACDFVGDNLW